MPSKKNQPPKPTNLPPGNLDWSTAVPYFIPPQIQPITNNYTTNIHITNFNALGVLPSLPLPVPSIPPCDTDAIDSLSPLSPSTRHHHLLHRELINAFYISLGNPDGTTRHLVYRWLRTEAGIEILSKIFGLSGRVNAAGIKGGIETVLRVLDPRYREGLLRRGNVAAHVFSLEEAMGVVGVGGGKAGSSMGSSGPSVRPSAPLAGKDLVINDTDTEAQPVLKAILNLLRSKSQNPAMEDLKTAAYHLKLELLGLYPRLQEVVDIEKTAGRGNLVNDILYRMRGYGEEEKIGIVGEVRWRVEKDPTDTGRMDWWADEGEEGRGRYREREGLDLATASFPGIPQQRTPEKMERMGSPSKQNWDASSKNMGYQKQPGLNKLDMPWRSAKVDQNKNQENQESQGNQGFRAPSGMRNHRRANTMSGIAAF